MEKVIVIGGGWAGCSAALQARKEGARVKLLERTDLLLGTGLVGGIMNNNGRYTAAAEMKALGGGELFEVIAENLRHQNICFPGHAHADLYDIGKIGGAVFRYLEQAGIEIVCECRITRVRQENGHILYVEDMHKNRIAGDVFIDATGTAGPMSNCSKYGNGCAMCVLRCPTFGGRVSVAEAAGVEEINARKEDGTLGAMSGSCKLYKESLSEEIRSRLEREGIAVIPLPEELREDHLSIKSCQQYALKEFRDNLILLDTGHGKLMVPYFPIAKLRCIPGFENVRYEDPYAAGRGNSMRFFSMSPRNNQLQVSGVKNLFCAGEKAGPLVGHTEAIVTGVLAGYNSVRQARGEMQLELPRQLAIGDAIEAVSLDSGKKYTFSGSVYFERMKEKGLYSLDKKEIYERVEKAGLLCVFKSNAESAEFVI